MPSLCVHFKCTGEVNQQDDSGFLCDRMTPGKLRWEMGKLTCQSMTPGLPYIPLTLQCVGRIKGSKNPQRSLHWLFSNCFSMSCCSTYRAGGYRSTGEPTEFLCPQTSLVSALCSHCVYFHWTILYCQPLVRRWSRGRVWSMNSLVLSGWLLHGGP